MGQGRAMGQSFLFGKPSHVSYDYCILIYVLSLFPNGRLGRWKGAAAVEMVYQAPSEESHSQAVVCGQGPLGSPIPNRTTVVARG